MSDIEAYDAQVQAYIQPILDGFRVWLEQSGLSEKTVENHVENIDGNGLWLPRLRSQYPVSHVLESIIDIQWVLIAFERII